MIRVYMANLDPLPASILSATLLANEGIEVVDDDSAAQPDAGYWDRLVGQLARARPDVVIFGEESPTRAVEMATLLDARVFVLTSRGTTLRCLPTRSDPEVVTPISLEELLDRIRG